MPGETMSTNSVELSPPPRASANPPFNAVSMLTDAVILKSSDGVSFHVYKSILGIASPFFAQMFLLPQPTEEFGESPGLGCKSGDEEDGLQVLNITEDSRTIDTLLRLIYPVRKPPGLKHSCVSIEKESDLINLIEPALVAAIKYDMTLVVEDLCAQLISPENWIPAEEEGSGILPLRVYAIACRYKLLDEAKAAARACLRVPILNQHFPELKTISAERYFLLLNYHQKVAEAVLPLFRISNDKKSTGLPDSCRTFAMCRNCTVATLNSYDSYDRGVAKWWENYAARAAEVLKVSPRSQDIYSSTFLASTFNVAEHCDQCKIGVHGKWHSISRALQEEMDKLSAKVRW